MTLDDVRSAAAALKAAGTRPSHRAILARLGETSKRAVEQHVHALLEEDPDALSLPPPAPGSPPAAAPVAVEAPSAHPPLQAVQAQYAAAQAREDAATARTADAKAALKEAEKALLAAEATARRNVPTAEKLRLRAQRDAARTAQAARLAEWQRCVQAAEPCVVATMDAKAELARVEAEVHAAELLLRQATRDSANSRLTTDEQATAETDAARAAQTLARLRG
jgi:hypothetical protein